MTKSKRGQRKSTSKKKSQTNLSLIFGSTFIGALVLFGLLYLALREPAATTLAAYCRQNGNNCAIIGNPSAPVSVVEVSDYGCSHCRDFNLQTAPLLEAQYVETGEVQWMVMPFALSTKTLAPAEAALCADDQGRFLELHEAFFANQSSPNAFSEAWVLSTAASVGLDMPAFESCYNSGQYADAVQANLRAARSAGVNATPTFFINGQKVEGNIPFATFQQRLNALLSS